MRAVLPLLLGVGVWAAGGAPTVVFSESFDSNAAGWTLGPEWQIGPAKISKGHAQGNPDPARDHTGMGGNGIAGVQIGGNAIGSSHSEAYWLTSPVIPVSGARRVVLRFERWLNSDQAPYMTNRVEAWNGARWVTLWEPPNGESVADREWVSQAFDVTALQNPKFQVRFGFARQPGAFVASSWNLDDVRVEAEVGEKPAPWGFGILAALLAMLPMFASR